MRQPFVFLLCCLYVAMAQAQETQLYLPRNFELAYEKNTRSADGAPGKAYWQNRSDYRIRVELDPKEREIEGYEDVTYFHNAPDSLKLLRIKLIHDLYKKGGQRSDDLDPKDIDEGVEIERLEINGVAVPANKQNRHDTYLDIRLDKPVPTGGSIRLTVAWEYTLPQAKDATRECVCDPSTFFVPYFYPEIAVYDDLHGWASAPYNGLQEFYHDFSNYDVEITLPKGYMVWATGELQNAAELLNKPYLERWNLAHQSTDIIKIFTEAELKNAPVFKKAKKHVFRYKATEVPDFTFAASNHYNWDATSVTVDDKTGRKTFVSAAYNTESNDFKRVARIAADGIRLMSTYLPGYPFPYPCLTVFNGNDGMEYPMMINDASVGEEDVVGLTVHESAHTYFPFMMGINEQYYAWMDEGWANFTDHFVGDSIEHKSSRIGGWGFGNDWEVPPMVPSRSLDGASYGFASYTRPQLAYTQLLDMLGYETFHRCMTTYIDRWKGKHPGPYDFFNTFNDASGQNLNWFWKPWFFEFGYPDLGIQSVARQNDGNADWVVFVEKKGVIPVPIHLEVEYSDGSKETVHQSAAAWSSGKALVQVPLRGKSGQAPVKVTLGGKTIPDSKRKNDVWQKPGK
jgi:hypothetical protein